MPLSRERNRERMRQARATCVQPKTPTVVQPSTPTAKLVQPKLAQRLAAAGLTVNGNKVSIGTKPGSVQPNVPVYNPSVHKPGDRVLVRSGSRLVEAVVPRLDADGRPMPW